MIVIGKKRLLVPPALEPVSLDEVKSHLRILPGDAVSEDYLSGLISVAREKVESTSGRALILQTWEMVFDGFPGDSNCPVKLELPPLHSVVSVKYFDGNEVEQTWDSSLYQVNVKSTPGMILPVFGRSYPGTGRGINPVTVEFKAGYGAGRVSVPASIRHAMKLIIGELYARREEGIAGATVTTIPVSAQNLINPYMIFEF